MYQINEGLGFHKFRRKIVRKIKGVAKGGAKFAGKRGSLRWTRRITKKIALVPFKIAGRTTKLPFKVIKKGAVIISASPFKYYGGSKSKRVVTSPKHKACMLDFNRTRFGKGQSEVRRRKAMLSKCRLLMKYTTQRPILPGSAKSTKNLRDMNTGLTKKQMATLVDRTAKNMEGKTSSQTPANPQPPIIVKPAVFPELPVIMSAPGEPTQLIESEKSEKNKGMLVKAGIGAAVVVGAVLLLKS